MIQTVYDAVPEKAKMVTDIGAGVAAIAAFFEHLHGPLSTLAVFAALVYTVIRIYYTIKRKGK